MSSAARTKGFTFVEAIVATTLAAVGIAAAMQGIASITRMQAQASQKQHLTHLAIQKLDELIGIGEVSEQGGTFEEQGEVGITWELEVQDTGVTNLNELIVTVTQGGETNSPSVQVEGLAVTDTGETAAAQ